MGKYLAGEKLVNLTNREVFAKIFLANIHRYTENVFGKCTDVSLFANNFHLYDSPKFSLAKYFCVQ